VTRRQDARAVSYRDGIIKIMIRSSATGQYLRAFEQELKDRMMEKFHDTKYSRMLLQINPSLHEDVL
jgi:hypothetical protein